MLSWALAVKDVMATNVRTKRVLRSSRGLIIIPFLSSRESLVVYQVLGLGPWALGLWSYVLGLGSWCFILANKDQSPKAKDQHFLSSHLSPSRSPEDIPHLVNQTFIFEVLALYLGQLLKQFSLLTS